MTKKQEQQIEQLRFEMAQIEKQKQQVLGMSEGSGFSAVKTVIEAFDRDIAALKKEMKALKYA